MCHPGFFYLNEGSPQGLLQQLTLSQGFWTSCGLEEGTCFPDKSELFQLQPGMACITAAHLPRPTPVVHKVLWGFLSYSLPEEWNRIVCGWESVGNRSITFIVLGLLEHYGEGKVSHFL